MSILARLYWEIYTYSPSRALHNPLICPRAAFPNSRKYCWYLTLGGWSIDIPLIRVMKIRATSSTSPCVLSFSLSEVASFHHKLVWIIPLFKTQQKASLWPQLIWRVIPDLQFIQITPGHPNHSRKPPKSDPNPTLFYFISI